MSGPLYRNRHDHFDVLLEVQSRSRQDGWIDFFTQAMIITCDESMTLAAQVGALRRLEQVRWLRRAESASRRRVAQRLGVAVDPAGDKVLASTQPASEVSSQFSTANPGRR